MGKRARPRIMRVTGFLVLSPRDESYSAPTSEILMDGKMGFWGLGELDELTVTELPKATKTKEGIRTDV